MNDPVNHPSHYTQGEIECIDAIESALTPEEFGGFCKATALQYIWRERFKGGVQDLEKAKWFIDREIQRRRRPEKTIGDRATEIVDQVSREADRMAGGL